MHKILGITRWNKTSLLKFHFPAIIGFAVCCHVTGYMAKSTAKPQEAREFETESPQTNALAAKSADSTSQDLPHRENGLAGLLDSLATAGVDREDLRDGYAPQLMALLNEYYQLSQADADIYDTEQALQSWFSAEDRMRKQHRTIRPLSSVVAWSFYNRQGVEGMLQEPTKALADLALARQFYLLASSECSRAAPTLQTVGGSIDYYQAWARILEHKGYLESASHFMEHAVQLGVDLRFEEAGYVSPLTQKVRDLFVERPVGQGKTETPDQAEDNRQITEARKSDNVVESSKVEKCHHLLPDHIIRLTELARIYAAQGKNKLAEAMYLRAIELGRRPGADFRMIHVFATVPLVELAMEDDRRETAEKYLSIIRDDVKEFPQSLEGALAARLAARSALDQRDPKSAVTFLQKARRILEAEEVHELDATIGSLKQECFRKMDAVTRATQEYRITLSLLADSQIANKSYQEAKQVLSELLSHSFSSAEPLESTVEIIDRLRRCAEALGQQNELRSWARKQQVIQTIIDSKKAAP